MAFKHTFPGVFATAAVAVVVVATAERKRRENVTNTIGSSLQLAAVSYGSSSSQKKLFASLAQSLARTSERVECCEPTENEIHFDHRLFIHLLSSRSRTHAMYTATRIVARAPAGYMSTTFANTARQPTLTMH